MGLRRRCPGLCLCRNWRRLPRRMRDDVNGLPRDPGAQVCSLLSCCMPQCCCASLLLSSSPGCSPVPRDASTPRAPAQPLLSWLSLCNIASSGVKSCLTSCLISQTATALRGDYFVFNLLSANHLQLRSGKGHNADRRQSVPKQNNSSVATKGVNEKILNQFLTKRFQEVLPHLPTVI